MSLLILDKTSDVSSLIHTIDCDSCKKSVDRKDALKLGESKGERGQTWFWLCPPCYSRIYKQYVIPSLALDKQKKAFLKKELQMDEGDIRMMLAKHADIWKQW